MPDTKSVMEVDSCCVFENTRAPRISVEAFIFCEYRMGHTKSARIVK
jgi:hypothetical protein